MGTPLGSGASRPLRAPLYALMGANAISLTGNTLTLVAIPWFVLQTTGSASKTGITAFFSILPVVVATFFGGTLVDRLGYKRASVFADLASMVSVALIPILYAAGLLEFPVLLALVFLGALFDAPGQTARSALVPDLAPRAGMSLERAGSAVQVTERGAGLLGAPLGGVLIAALGPVNVLWIDAATFAVSAAMVAIAVPTAEPKPETPRDAYLSELREGLSFIRRDGLILAVVLTVMVTNFLDAALASVIQPVLASRVYGSPVALGLLFGVSGGGAVVGAVAYGWVGQRLPKRPLFIGAFVLTSLPVFVLAALPPLGVALVAWGVRGLSSGPINPLLSAIEYERIPADMRGRVFGAITAGAYVAMPLGVLVAGYALELVGLRLSLLAVAACYLATTLTLAANPGIREMDEPSVAAASVRAR